MTCPRSYRQSTQRRGSKTSSLTESQPAGEDIGLLASAMA